MSRLEYPRIPPPSTENNQLFHNQSDTELSDLVPKCSSSPIHYSRPAALETVYELASPASRPHFRDPLVCPPFDIDCAKTVEGPRKTLNAKNCQ
jgi:hypothetical protein